MGKNSKHVLVFYLLFFVGCFLTVHVAGKEYVGSAGLIMKRAKALVEECGCPYSCVVRIKSCLRSGECTSCKIPTYGKRGNSFYTRAYLQERLEQLAMDPLYFSHHVLYHDNSPELQLLIQHM